MSNFRTIMTTASLAVLLIASFLIALAAVPETVHAYSVRDPIYIMGDSDFTAANGVTGGSGTAPDPYLIEGWEINASSAHGIRIQDTTAHFTIRDCYVYDGDSANHYGVSLTNVSNGSIVDNVLSANWFGVYLYSSSTIMIDNNSCTENNWGMLMRDSAYNALSNNTCTVNFYEGIVLDTSCSNNILRDNNCSDNNDDGIYIDNACNNTLINNTCSNGDYGIILTNSGSNNNALINNNCSSNSFDGILLSNSHNNTLIENNCSNSVNGIHLTSSCSNTLIRNNCSQNDAYGLYLESSSNDNTLSDNNCSSNNGDGIDIYSSDNNTVSNNDCSRNSYGMYLESSNNNTVRGNNCSSNSNHGAYLGSSNNNTVRGNNCSNNGIGIGLESSDNNILRNNTCGSNDVDGILLSQSSSNTIRDCKCSSNLWDGMYFYLSSDNSLINNSCSSNGYGMTLSSSNRNTLGGNNASSNTAGGFYVSDSTGTLAFRNIFFDNPDHAYDDNGDENLWNASYPVGGNYWDNYTGVDEYSGPNQDEPGPDGIGDTPYEIDADSHDYYPLMEPPNMPPTASFTVSPSTGYVNTVFSVDASSSSDVEDDLSELEVRWDWESDGDWDTPWTAVKIDTHQYSTEANHTITLEVRDTKGLVDNTTRQITVVHDDVPPIADAGPDQIVDEDTPVNFDGSGSSDNLGIVNYTWTFVDGTERVLYEVSPTYSFEEPGEYTVTLDVSDDAENHDTDTVVITVLSVNEPPTADAGADQTVTAGDTVMFDGSGSSDDSAVENYTWTFTYDGVGQELHEVEPTFTFDIVDTYTVTLTVTDDEGATDTDEVVITVEEAPAVTLTADAGSNQTVDAGDTVTFDGGESTGDIVSYTWTFEYDGETEILTGESPTFVFDIAGEYEVTLTVEDVEGSTDTDTVTITVEEEDEKSFIEQYGLALGVIIALIVVGMALFFLMKKRKGGETKIGSEEPPANELESSD